MKRGIAKFRKWLQSTVCRDDIVCTIEVHPRCRAYIMRGEGSLSMGDSLCNLLTEAAAAATMRGYNRLIFDWEHVTFKLSVTDMYNVVTSFEDCGINRNLGIAFVSSRPEDAETYYLLETMALNRGYLFRYFTEKQPAKDWLCE